MYFIRVCMPHTGNATDLRNLEIKLRQGTAHQLRLAVHEQWDPDLDIDFVIEHPDLMHATAVAVVTITRDDEYTAPKDLRVRLRTVLDQALEHSRWLEGSRRRIELVAKKGGSGPMQDTLAINFGGIRVAGSLPGPEPKPDST